MPKIHISCCDDIPENEACYIVPMDFSVELLKCVYEKTFRTIIVCDRPSDEQFETVVKEYIKKYPNNKLDFNKLRGDDYFRCTFN